ncbi:MAG: ABC-F family ATP-binding cassette domain-containing protein [Lachnospiraceae bacterium]|nr:ABC-F family ATP-binding cassette domain-containing protein [Lachnospiraceae bacterium]
MYLSVSNLSKSFGDRSLFDGISFSLDKNERLGICGPNGCGKTTLLKILMGEEDYDSGSINISGDLNVGYLAQYQSDMLKGNILDVVLSSKSELIKMESKLRDMEEKMNSLSGEELKIHLNHYHEDMNQFEKEGGYVFRSQAVGVLKGLGFSEEEFSLDFNSLSGGQKTRVSLGRLLLSNPDILILDEPTNHLDISSVEWLEGFLSSYNGALILVSHDRYFLDHIIDHVLDIAGMDTRLYTGNYTEYVEKKRIIVNSELKAFEKQQDKIAHEEEVIKTLQRFNREKSIKRAESRKKVLDKITVLDKPEDLKDPMRLNFVSGTRSGNDVLCVSDLSKGFDGNTLFSNLSFLLTRKERLAILGDNGTGKTTLLRILNGLIPPDTGTVKIGSNVTIGYYDQAQQNLCDDNTVFTELRNEYPTFNDTRIRNTLAAFGFSGEEVDKRISDLSGGERGRVSLAKLTLKDANLLILDEPTNHLDIRAKEILEDALLEYEGTLLFVSHDRYFVNRIATRIIEINEDLCKSYLGNYDDYIQKKKELETSTIVEAESVEKTENKIDYNLQKQEKARKQKIQRSIDKVEERISMLEEIIDGLDLEMADPNNAVNSAKLNELSAKRQKADDELSERYSEWEELQEELND